MSTPSSSSADVVADMTCLLLWSLSCYALSRNVHQVPSAILGRLHHSVTISCSHSITSCDTIMWFQQAASDSELKLIGYGFYSSPNTEESSRFEVTGDASKKAELRVLNLTHPEDSGIYYCAAFTHSDTLTFFSLQKLTYKQICVIILTAKS
ncbi:hypothetical protein Q5P01_016729 [Channa striata]|uniref:Ig-like domain-containing protein n=1 Tax=Channa striata TaxID=64152 RepID=A0AA88M8M4_CHASR|nr:hypothetical protein Q5P01_016729 [Channa striata]